MTRFDPGSFLQQLARLVGPQGLLTDPSDIAPFVTDWRGLKRGTALAVVRPKTAQETAQVVRACSEWRVAILPQGGNTGLTYATVDPSPGHRIILSLSRMNAIRSVDRTGMTMEVEAGCILSVVKAAAAESGRLMPISLAAEGSAQIGGILATNAGGVNVLRYGMARQMVLGLEAVLADGSIISSLRALRKDNAGYDWKQLLIGSEGTLAIITAATLRLVPQPRYTQVALLAVPGVDAALSLLALMQDELGDAISAFELMSDEGLDLVEQHFALKRPVAKSSWVVLVEAQASLNGLRDGMEMALEHVFQQGLALDGVLAESEEQAKRLWSLREHLTEAEQREGASIKHDVSVPIPNIAAFLKQAPHLVRALAPDATFNLFGHLGDGNIHFNVLSEDPGQTTAINDAVHALVIEMGGSISAEHGIGRYRLTALAAMRSPQEMLLMRRLKAALDPTTLLNPGAVLAQE
jgi:FAD/FMN-containing dehydrogenase